MDRAARIYQIHDELRRSRRPVPLQRFREKLEVSDATIKRDIGVMRDYLGAPLEYDFRANGRARDRRSERRVHPVRCRVGSPENNLVLFSST